MPGCRTIITILIVACVGSIIIAWSAAIFAPPPGFDPQQTAALRRAQEVRAEMAPRTDAEDDLWIESAWTSHFVNTLITRSTIDGVRRTRLEHGFGWPWPSMVAWHEVAGGPPITTHDGGFTIDRPFDLHAPRVSPPLVIYALDRIVPTRLDARGLATNTTVITLTSLSITWLLLTLRAIVRRSRGRCPACAYRLLAPAMGCPECGWRYAVNPTLDHQRGDG